MPDGVNVFGVFLACSGCGSRYKFDGEKTVKKLRRKQHLASLAGAAAEVGVKSL